MDAQRETNRQLEALRAQLEELRIENRRLRQKADGERTGWPEEKKRGLAPVVLPPPPPLPPPPVVPSAPKFRCGVCAAGAQSDEGLCRACGYPLRNGPAPAKARDEQPRERRETPAAVRPQAGPRPQAPTWIDRIQAWQGAVLEHLREKGAERLVGEKLLNYVGMFLLVLGGAFFLKYAHGLSGPYGKLAIALVCGGALAALGERLRRDEGTAAFSLPVIGGGWTLVYYAVYAAHYVEASRIIADPWLEFGLLCAAAAGMIGHSLLAGSRALTLFAFGAAQSVFALTGMGLPAVTASGVLAAAAAFLVRPLRSPELAAVNLAGFTLNELPVFRDVIAASGGFPVPAFWHNLAAATLVQLAYGIVAPARDDDGREPSVWLDAALSAGSIAYACGFYAQVRAQSPAAQVTALASAGAILTLLSGLQSGRSAAAGVQTFLGAVVTILGVLELGLPVERLWGFALAAAAFGSFGAWTGRKGIETAGFVMAGLAGSTLLGDVDEMPRGLAACAFGFLSSAAYTLAAWKGAAGDRGARTGLWFYGGLASATLGLWTWLEPPAFAVSALALAILLELASRELELPELFQQAALLEAGIGLYGFAIEYGANLPILGPLTARAVAVSALSAGLAGLVFLAPSPEGRLLGVRHASWRVGHAWLFAATAAFAAYHELGPRMRLPFWAASCLALLALGRRRGEGPDEAARPHFRAQAYALAAATALEAVGSYLLVPGALLDGVGALETAIFVSASLALLSPLAWRAWSGSPAERSEELGASHLFACLSLAMLACFTAKEASGAHVTLGWTGLGAGYLAAGLALHRRALRLPGLALLALCVLKALLRDLTGLALPYKVLSYTVLGALLVLSSYLYVRTRKEADSDAA